MTDKELEKFHESYISDEDDKFIRKKVHQAIRSYNWEKKTHELLDSYLDWMFQDSVLDAVFEDLLADVMRTTLEDHGLIRKKGE